MNLNKPFLLVFLILLIVPVSLLALGLAKAEERQDTPETRLIEACIDNMDKLQSAKITVEGYFTKDPDRKIEFSFDGLIRLPGDLDGILKLSSSDFMIKGRTVSIEGEAWFLNPLEERWEKSDPNQFHIKTENPLFSVPEILWLISYFPEYLEGGTQHGEEFLNGTLTDYLKFDLDLDKLRYDATRSDQPEELVFMANALTGDNVQAKIWIDRKTKYLSGLEFELDEFLANQTPVGVKIKLADHNLQVNIEKPDILN